MQSVDRRLAVIENSRSSRRKGAAPCRDEEPKGSNLSALGKRDRMVDIDPELADSVLNVRMTEQDLDGAQNTGCLLDQERVRSSHRMRAVFGNV